jgi:hypothetical protein
MVLAEKHKKKTSVQGLFYITILFTLFTVYVSVCNAQVAGMSKKDTSVSLGIKALADTTLDKIKNVPETIQNSLKNKGKQLTGMLTEFKKNKPDSIFKTQFHSFLLRNSFKTKPLIKFTGGFNAYNFNYRSYIDTPVAEINIYQHYATGSIGFSAGLMPFKVNYLFSTSNSVLFKNIRDVQFVFDAAQYKNNLYRALKNTLISFAARVKDTVLEMNYNASLKRLNSLSDLLYNHSPLQKLIEYQEIIDIPGLSTDISLSDSINKRRIDSAQNIARSFLDKYYFEKKQLDSFKVKVDSLKQLYEKMLLKVNTVNNIVNGKFSGDFNVAEMETALAKLGINEKIIPKKYRRLLNIKKMGIGRNLLNYSELTSKNISLKGINFEYNSKGFYVAVAAGTVDYRYRDFIIHSGLKSPQYMYMLRIGKGRVEGNHLFVTYYKGRKQVNFSSNSIQRFLEISGISGELKYILAKNTALIAEVAESISADLKTTPVSYSKFGITDNKNKAVSVKLNSYFPKTRTRINALYKYTGANFQSFSTFQTNAAIKAWHIKIDQNLLKRRLKITGAIRTNDFSNPYILQQYTSNTIFKSLQVTYRAKHFPSISLGYSPVSQLIKLDNQIIDNQFNSLNGLITHTYKLGIAPSSSTFMYSKFYNTTVDTAYAYYNAANIFFTQTVAFTYYTMSVALSHSKSKEYELNILDGGLQCKITKMGTVGLGVKVNNFNKQNTKTSLYGSLQLNLKKWGVLSMVYDNGYIPAANRVFIKNDLFNLVFTQSF